MPCFLLVVDVSMYLDLLLSVTCRPTVNIVVEQVSFHCASNQYKKTSRKRTLELVKKKMDKKKLLLLFCLVIGYFMTFASPS